MGNFYIRSSSRLAAQRMNPVYCSSCGTEIVTYTSIKEHINPTYQYFVAYQKCCIVCEILGSKPSDFDEIHSPGNEGSMSRPGK